MSFVFEPGGSVDSERTEGLTEGRTAKTLAALRHAVCAAFCIIGQAQRAGLVRRLGSSIRPGAYVLRATAACASSVPGTASTATAIII